MVSMGTNFYTKTAECPTCGHKPEGIHLGKSSFGWNFSFQYNGGKYYKNVRAMKKWLKDKQIVNEYGESVTHEDFWKMVRHKQKQPLNCAEEMTQGGRINNSTYFVIDGYSFTDCDFS